jgi:hypothetical protein
VCEKSYYKSFIKNNIYYKNEPLFYFNNKNFDVNSDNKNIFDNKQINRKKNYNNKLNDLNWSIVNSSIKNKFYLNSNPKNFMKYIYTKLIKKIYVNNKNEYNMTFFTDIGFIIKLLKLFRKKLNNNIVLNITHNGVIKFIFKYNIKSFDNNFDKFDIIHPTNSFHPLYNTINNDYYYKFNNFPLNYKKIDKKLLTYDLIKRCENYKKIYKKLSKI